MIKPTKLAASLFLLLASSTAIASGDCENETNWSAVRACAYESQMADLNAVYQDTLKFIARDNAKAAELLKLAQASWLDYATKSCEFTVASRLPDSNDLSLGCWQIFIDARVKVLKSYKRDHGKVPNDLMHP